LLSSYYHFVTIYSIPFLIFVSFDNFRWIPLGILLEIKGKMGGQKKPLGGGTAKGRMPFSMPFAITHIASNLH